MSSMLDNSVSFCCSLDGAAINYTGNSNQLVDRFVKSLAKSLGKKKIALTHQPDMNQAHVHVRFVQIEQGNQLLRYLLPFLSPAFVELETDLRLNRDAGESLHYRQNAQFGLFGGSPSSMLGLCMDRIGAKLGKDILKRVA